MAYISKLLSWPQVGDADIHSLKRLSFFLIQCKNAMNYVHDMTLLNYIPTIQTVLRKLPQYIQHKWLNLLKKINKKTHREADFSDLSNLVAECVRDAFHPAYSKLILNDKPNETSCKMSTNSHSDQHAKEPPALISARSCKICAENHNINECSVFHEMSLLEKKTMLFAKRLCYSCYADDHIASGCLQKQTCEICRKPHPTALHDPHYNKLNS